MSQQEQEKTGRCSTCKGKFPETQLVRLGIFGGRYCSGCHQTATIRITDRNEKDPRD